MFNLYKFPRLVIVACCSISLSEALPPDVWDDFEGPDGIIQDSSISSSGHVYDINWAEQGTHVIESGYYKPNLAATARIAYIKCGSTPMTVAAEFRFADVPGVTHRDHGENAVIGVCERGFGFNSGNGDGGSIQLCIYRDQWQLFVVEDPIVDPYPILASGSFSQPLVAGVNYKMAMHYDGDRTVLVDAPQGLTGIATDDRILEHWDGDKFGIQMRRPSSQDGFVEFSECKAYLTKKKSRKDFDGDGNDDMLWRNLDDGRTRIWTMNGAVKTKSRDTDFHIKSTKWTLQGHGDFNGDGYSDILWRVPDGRLLINFMEGNVRTGVRLVDFPLSSDWEVRVVEDFNRDGRADIYVRHQTTGATMLHYMDGEKRIGPAVEAGYRIRTFLWRPVAAGDFNGDNEIDVVWRHATSGLNIHFLAEAGTQRIGNSMIPTDHMPLSVGQLSDWRVVGAADYIGDAGAELILREISSGEINILEISGSQVSSTTVDGSFASPKWSIFNQ